VEEEVDRFEHRLGDEVEPAPVDQQLEAVQAQDTRVAFASAGRGPFYRLAASSKERETIRCANRSISSRPDVFGKALSKTNSKSRI